MPAKKITKEHKKLILKLKKQGVSDGQTYLRYMRIFFVDEKRPIEEAITYETMRDIVRRNKTV